VAGGAALWPLLKLGVLRRHRRGVICGGILLFALRPAPDTIPSRLREARRLFWRAGL